MRKRTYFDSRRLSGWPSPQELEHYFLAPPGRQWFSTGGNDGARFSGEGADGTEQLDPTQGRVDLDLLLWGNVHHGVLLQYARWGGGRSEAFASKGDLSRLGEFVRSMHDTLLPIGLFIPFEEAWKAVKEFLETDGKLPRSIAWIANSDLPPNTFPDS